MTPKRITGDGQSALNSARSRPGTLSSNNYFSNYQSQAQKQNSYPKSGILGQRLANNPNSKYASSSQRNIKQFAVPTNSSKNYTSVRNGGG